MNKTIFFIIVFFILIMGYSISYWVTKPVQTYTPYNGNSKNCASCHQNSISQGSWSGIPDWHNEKFCNPILNSENREEHRREAHNYRNKCMTCHAPNFQTKCANCHTLNEWK